MFKNKREKFNKFLTPFYLRERRKKKDNKLPVVRRKEKKIMPFDPFRDDEKNEFNAPEN